MEKDGSLKPGFFRNKAGISCDLAILSTEERSRRGYVKPPWPDEAGLVEIRVSQVRARGSDVTHEPDRELDNYAHCVFTKDLSKPEAKKLAKEARVVIAQRLR